jgi:hypothetical protein
MAVRDKPVDHVARVRLLPASTSTAPVRRDDNLIASSRPSDQRPCEEA